MSSGFYHDKSTIHLNSAFYLVENVNPQIQICRKANPKDIRNQQIPRDTADFIKFYSSTNDKRQQY